MDGGCWLGVLKAGGVVVTTMAALRAREIGPIVERTRPSIALVDHRFADDVVAVRTVGPGPGRGSLRGRRTTTSSRRVEAKSGEFTAVGTAADDVALLGPTSGSTGVPKITMHFHRDMLSIDNTFGRHLELGPTMSSPAPRRWPSPSAWACSWSSRCGPERAPC